MWEASNRSLLPTIIANEYACSDEIENLECRQYPLKHLHGLIDVLILDPVVGYHPEMFWSGYPSQHTLFGQFDGKCIRIDWKRLIQRHKNHVRRNRGGQIQVETR